MRTRSKTCPRSTSSWLHKALPEVSEGIHLIPSMIWRLPRRLPRRSAGWFARYLAGRGIAWPKTDTGRLKLDEDTFKDMSKVHPELAPLRELRHSLSELRLEKLAVGTDGRNRTMLSPFGASSGRNTPSANRFIFGPSVWLRGLIKPGPGMAIAYIDWSSQEVAIAAALSGDPFLLDSVASGDPYLSFAKRAGLVPEGATKATHAAVRDICKACVLGVNYGMQARTLAFRTGTSVKQKMMTRPFRRMGVAVGTDGRNRTMLSPFGASSGRNTPSANRSSSVHQCGCGV